ncbi:MAG: Rrf2 family transcriptional regulator [Gemmatimonadales bacterium]|jgi:Rrf2 family protein|nr:MAG: Rrf2 family transcriptional regulator [Gemmatimonadales bacterium]
MFSGTSEYALSAVFHLAKHWGSGPEPVAEIAGAIGVPANYLSKIMHAMARAGVVKSSRGKHGGFELSRPAEEVSLLDVVSVFESVDARRRCLLGRAECSDERACAVHSRWSRLGEEVARFVRETTVADVVGQPARVAGRTP